MITSRHPQSCDAIGTAAPPRVRALLHERRAWTLACSGARPREVEQALGQASDALTLPDSAEGPDWAAWADETELQVITGRCLTAIGQPRRAIPALRDALAAFDDAQARDKALYLTGSPKPTWKPATSTRPALPCGYAALGERTEAQSCRRDQLRGHGPPGARQLAGAQRMPRPCA